METVPVVAAVILAAGGSERMGSPKALLPDGDGEPFVARLVRTFFSAGITNVVVVTGARHDEIARALRLDAPPSRARLVRNPDPSRGQLSSLWVGLDAVEQAAPEGVLMTLVDVPLVSQSTVRAVVDAWRTTRAPIVRPAAGDRHGHPVLFDRVVFDELRRAPLDEGAKAVVHARAHEVVNVSVDDEGSFTDVDTPADYERVFGRLPPRAPTGP